MQKNEATIKKIVQTINESPVDVQGDAVLLGQIFQALQKKKKRRKALWLFLSFAFVLSCSGVVIRELYFRPSQPMESNNNAGTFIHNPLLAQAYIPVLDDVKENDDPVQPVTKNRKRARKDEPKGFINVVSYKFNNHQVDVFKNGSEGEYMQINVFGSDGAEEDVLKIMEDLKRSYRNKELYVDSVKHK